MKTITRFCPTTSGYPHVGHLYLALVNAVEAHKTTQGKFILRIDDSQSYWNWKLGRKEVMKIGSSFIEELEQFMTINAITWQSELPDRRETLPSGIDYLITERFLHDQSEEWIPDDHMALFPYAPKFTFERVYWDFLDGINWLIRGEDLVSEASLYNFFVEVMGFPRVKQTYLPRLRAKGREELHYTEISKTFRNYNLKKQIKEFGTLEIIRMLKESCLKDPSLDFTVDNIKWNPTITGFIE